MFPDRVRIGNHTPPQNGLRPSSVGTDLGRDLAIVFALGSALRIVLLLAFPVPYGNDGFGRLFFRDQLFLSHWLPLTQAIVWLCGWFESGILGTRIVFALLGAASACSFYLFLRTLVRREAAFLVSLFFTFNALYLNLSLMPYQDVLSLGLFYAALAFLWGHPDGRASVAGCLLFGLASLTRYEPWFAIPALVLKPIRERDRSTAVPGGILKAALFLGWGPLCWLVMSTLRWGSWNSFLFRTQDGQFYGWHPHFDLSWAVTYALQMLYWALLFSSPLILLAITGVIRLVRRQTPMTSSLRVLFSAGLLVLLFFFVIGKQQETVFRFIGFPLSIGLVMVALGVEGWLNWIERRQLLVRAVPRMLVGVTLILSLMIYSAIPIQRLNHDPEYRDPYQIVIFLEGVVDEGESVLVVADRFRDFSDAAPLAYQRIAAQTRLPRGRVLSAGLLQESDPERLRSYARSRNVGYLVIFGNFEPWQPADIFFAELARSNPQSIAPVLETETALVYRVDSW